MGYEVSEIQSEIQKVKEHLRTLQRRLRKVGSRYMSEENKIKQVQKQLKAKYPKANPDRELLSLVGSLPNPRVGYKEAVRQVIAERHAR
jgi:DNA anti-recombination protein RmuC